MKAGKEKPQAEKTPRAKAAKEKPVPTLQLETAQVDYGVYVMTPAETLTAWLAAAAVLFAVAQVALQLNRVQRRFGAARTGFSAR